MKKLDVPQSGSQADTTASRNRFGQYNRTRATPVQPRTPAQLAVRGYLSDASQAWRDLTDAERAGWNAYAATVAKTDSLGQTIYNTGHQAFVALWCLYSSAGLATPPDVPVDTPMPPIAIDSFSFDASTPEMALDVSPGLGVGEVALVYASEQVSAGVSFMRDLRLISVVPGAMVPVDAFGLTAAYVAKFGALIAGRRVFLRIVLVRATSAGSAPTEMNAVISA